MPEGGGEIEAGSGLEGAGPDGVICVPPGAARQMRDSGDGAPGFLRTV